MDNTSTGSNTIVPQVLGDDNYATWSSCIKNYLLAHDLWDIVENPFSGGDDQDSRKLEDDKVWKRQNAAALHAIQMSCGPEMLSRVTETSSANIAWNTLAQIHRNNPQSLEIIDTCNVNSGSLPLANDSGNRETINSVTATDEYAEYQPLVQAINTGDLEAVKDFIEHSPHAKTAKLNSIGFTALHLATEAGQVKIVKELVQRQLSPEDLELQDNRGFTALHTASQSGNIKIAMCIINAVKNKNILGIATEADLTPVGTACCGGYKKLTRYLYSITPHELLDGINGSNFLYDVLTIKCFDVALDLIKRYPHLGTFETRYGIFPLEALSKMPSVFPRGSRLSFWREIVSRCIHIQLPSSNQLCLDIHQNEDCDEENISERKPVISKILRVNRPTLLKILGIEELYEMKLNQLYATEILHCICQKLPLSLSSMTAFFEAIKHGTVEVVVEMCKADPTLLTIVVEHNSGRSLFFLAIQYRQESIFSLIYGLKTRKDLLTSRSDYFNNSMLHVAGMKAPPNQLDHISGAALQMQRELQWYKEVERVMNISSKDCYNSDKDQPHQVFSKEHKELMKQGEAWMKENAISCSFVAALIITIMFTAAFTIPGGNDQNTGYPMFLKKASFKVFVISDAISLFSATTSVLMFLGILTSRFAEEDFLKALPTKLIIRLSTLFISIAAMMVAFCATLIIMFKGQLNIGLPIVVLASFPIAAFIWLQSPLLIEIFMSTYGPSIFNRKMKPWL